MDKNTKINDNTIFNLTNKVAVLIGGNGYLGRQFCRSLLAFGATVYSLDRDASETTETKTLKKHYPQRFTLLAVDASKKEDLQRVKNHIVAKEKHIDILITTTTAKGDDFYQPFEDVSLEGWNIGLMGNLTIPFLAIQAFIPVMKHQRSGSIINISSHYGIVGNDQRIYAGTNLDKVYLKHPTKETKQTQNQIYSHGVYNAAKGGIINFTRYLAAYYGEYNIRINCISPGGIAHEGENEAFVKKYSEKVPLGRKGRPDEVNGAVIFLASDASSYVTGHNLVVDGGYTIW